MDEILWCDHSNQTSLTVLLRRTIYVSIFYRLKFGISLEFDFWLLFACNIRVHSEEGTTFDLTLTKESKLPSSISLAALFSPRAKESIAPITKKGLCCRIGNVGTAMNQKILNKF